MGFDLKRMFRIPTAAQRLAALDLRADLAAAALDMVSDERSDPHLKIFGNRLTASESVLRLIEGEHARRLGFLALTTERVLFGAHDAATTDAMTWDEVGDVRARTRGLTGQLTIVGLTGRDLQVDKILGEQGAQFAEAVRRRLTDQSTDQPRYSGQSHDPVHDLLQLRERRAAGTVSDADYRAAKQRLLDEL